jgi:enoyl-CoA hydratase/carnithine racemase
VDFDKLQGWIEDGVAIVEIRRPDKANAFDLPMWHGLRAAMRWVEETPDARVAILRGAGRHFSAGIDLALLQGILAQVADPSAERRRQKMLAIIRDLQGCVDAIERCGKPVIAAVHGSCLGGGLDIAAACDLRYCSTDARLAIKEIDLGITADLGSLQRLPPLIGAGAVAELAYTGRVVEPPEAMRLGLVNRVYDSPEALQAGVREMAMTIASKAPAAARGIKRSLQHARDHGVPAGLEQVAQWNAGALSGPTE